MTAGLVLDASVTAAWCFEDEADHATDALLQRVRDEGGLVPALWHWEVANVMTSAVRKKRLSADAAALRLRVLRGLPIATDREAQARAWREAFALAQSHALSAYDAAYLELAQREGLDLATKDAALRRAAAALGVKVVP
ncbi:MAG: type II toxin-antitoxin system VapC family toxin [Terricaulis sp.]|jgi:predicted nucleic acid-binding protein